MKIIDPNHLPKLYIYESIIDLNAQPSWREYFPNDAAGMNYAHVVCRNNNTSNQPQTPPDILLSKLSAGEQNMQRVFNFGNLLIKLDKKYDLWSLLFLCSTYLPMNGSINVRTVINEYAEKQDTNPAYMILHCSFGKLVYHFQLEQLYRVFTGSNDLQAAINFRKAFNKKDHAYINPVLKEQLEDGMSFRQFIENHRIGDFVFKPQWEATGKLIELLRFLGKIK
jgi:hypothetical protein